ncbi:acyltransferase family protein [Fusobacterium sp. MFO224]|uniref:acyltransferase family protein n=1 Tax=Fusobacterium sp. MFO224 TaxID=3378070 RepID=UPI003853F17B
MNLLISFLQIFGIILVVIGHSKENIPFLTKWIYSFHMPLFFFISGFLLKEKNNKISDINLFSFSKKKFIKLILPYVLISSVAYIPKALLSKFAMRPLDLSIQSYVHGLIYPWENPIILFWFLPTIFIILILFVFVFKIKEKFKIKHFIPIIILIFLFLNMKDFKNLDFLNLSGVINYSIFFALGIFYNLYQNKLNSLLKIENKLTTLILFIISCLIFKIDYNNLTTFIYAMNGILFSISLGKLYLKYNLNFLNHLYGASFSIYLFSWFPQVFIRILFLQILELNWFVAFISSIFFGIYAPFLLYKLKGLIPE